jgi:hypothetical protein
LGREVIFSFGNLLPPSVFGFNRPILGGLALVDGFSERKYHSFLSGAVSFPFGRPGVAEKNCISIPFARPH